MHTATDLYKNIAFLQYIWQDTISSRLICKVVPARWEGVGRVEGRE